MASGNFLIGNRLSLEGFNQYVIPFFGERGYSVKDKLCISYSGHQKSILATVIGEGDLEQKINGMLVELGPIIDKKETKKKEEMQNQYESIAWKHQVSAFSHWEGDGQERTCVNKGEYETIGTYQADNTASELFPSIAQEYLLRDVRIKANEVIKQVKDLLGKKLSDL